MTSFAFPPPSLAGYCREWGYGREEGIWGAGKDPTDVKARRWLPENSELLETSASGWVCVAEPHLSASVVCPEHNGEILKECWPRWNCDHIGSSLGLVMESWHQEFYSLLVVEPSRTSSPHFQVPIKGIPLIRNCIKQSSSDLA